MKPIASQLFLIALQACFILSPVWGQWIWRRPPLRPPPNPVAVQGPLQVSRGQITFDSEGNDNPGSIYFSRKPHVPSSSSGITIGRGYDLKERTQSQVYKDLHEVGIPRTIAQKFSKGAGLKGQTANNYLKRNNLESYTITHSQQKQLFYIAYDKIAADARRLATKADVVRAYGNTDWSRLNSAIKEVVVDLRYRGDYTPTTRRKIQRAVAANNLALFTELLSEEAYWVGRIRVPKDRFRRRRDALLRVG